MSPLTSIVFAVGLTAQAAAFGMCPMAFNTGSVGSCMFWGCSASRGPTHCTRGSCYCNEGYCRYPASHLAHHVSLLCSAGNWRHLSLVTCLLQCWTHSELLRE